MNHCLMYKIPFKEDGGVLKIIKNIKDIDCETAHFKNLGEESSYLNGIRDLKTHFEMIKIPEKSFEEGLSIKIEFFIPFKN